MDATLSAFGFKPFLTSCNAQCTTTYSLRRIATLLPVFRKSKCHVRMVISRVNLSPICLPGERIVVQIGNVQSFVSRVGPFRGSPVKYGKGYQ
jgi:hypothetical protein